MKLCWHTYAWARMFRANVNLFGMDQLVFREKGRCTKCGKIRWRWAP